MEKRLTVNYNIYIYMLPPDSETNLTHNFDMIYLIWELIAFAVFESSILFTFLLEF